MADGIEKKDNIEDKNLENFNKNFESELNDETFDKKAFSEIVSGQKFDENKSKEENFKNAFNTKVDNMIDKNLKNLSPEKIQELKDLQKKASEGKSTKELIESYKEISKEINNRNGESGKATSFHKEEADKNQQKSEKDSGDFLSKLKESIKENQKIAEEKSQKLEKEKASLIEKQNEERNGVEAQLSNLEPSQKENNESPKAKA